MSAADSPTNSMVTSVAEQGMASPSAILNTRQPGGKGVMFDLQFFHFLHEFRGLLETSIHAGETHIGDGVKSPETVHHAHPDGGIRHFAVVFTAEGVDDFLDHILDLIGRDGPFLAGSLDAGQKFFTGELLAPPVAFDDHETGPLDVFVSGETVRAGKTFAAAADGGAFTGGARIDHFIFLSSALWTSHRTAAKLLPMVAGL